MYQPTNMMLLLLTILMAFVTADDYAPIFIYPKGMQAYSKLVLFVPGGKVPPQDYQPVLSNSLSLVDASVCGVIVHCGALNLCDPLGQLPGLMDKAVAAVEKQTKTVFQSKDIIVVGHSLGGVGARHYVDTKYKTKGASAFAGLALMGTQYNGDHEDFKGTLGYPMSLKSFPIPLLSILGELDMVPTSHAATLFSSGYDTLENNIEKAKKSIVVVPGMDHSQFCSPFNVSGDLRPEITNEEALRTISAVVSAWIDVVLSENSTSVNNDKVNLLNSYVENSTRPLTAAFLAATAMESEQICRNAQKTILRDLPNASDIQALLDINVIVPNGSANLEHTHTKYTWTINTKGERRLNVTIGSYPYYPSVKSWNPIQVFGPTYQSASDISCKLLSADRIAEQMKINGYFPEKQPSATCVAINQDSIDIALNLLKTHWPVAVARWHRRGRQFILAPDIATVAGPQWVFLSSLKFSVHGKKSPVTVSSPELYSSISSSIFPGNYYCKVLSPAKALEWIMTTGLESRY
jgi:dienelactone hydrolase